MVLFSEAEEIGPLVVPSREEKNLTGQTSFLLLTNGTIIIRFLEAQEGGYFVSYLYGRQ